MSVDAPVAQLHTQNGPIYERSNLTRLQFLYWVAQAMRPHTPFLNTVVTFEIAGRVDAARFQEAFQQFLDRSDALRTVIVEEDGVPQRIIRPPFSFQLPIVVFSDELDSEAAYQDWLQDRMVRQINMAECLFDVALVKLADERFVWYVNQHHIIADASSFFLAFRYVAEAYEMGVDEWVVESGERPLFQQYIDYERQYRDSVRSQKAKSYWQKKLVPGPEPVRFNGQVPGKKSTCVTQISLDLGEPLSRQLRETAQQKDLFTVNLDLTLYNIFTSLFFIQLQKLTRNRRLGVVTPVHNRFTEEFRDIVGLLMELCPLQVEINEDDSFISVLKKVRREVRSTMPHYQFGSSISLQNETFDSMFNMHQVPWLELNRMPVRYSKMQVGHGSESLACHVIDYAAMGRFVVNLDFHDDVFDKTQREEAAASFVQLVQAFLDDPDQPINPVFSSVPAATAVNDVAPHIMQKGKGTAGSSKYTAPRNDMETQMVRIWEEVLGVSPVGVQDNFFDLGGSSWLATRLFVRIQEVTGYNLPLSTLLEAATVERMTQVMRDSSAGRLWSPIVTLKPNDSGKRPFFCVPGAGGNLLRLDKLVGYLHLDRPFMAFQVPGLDGEQKPYQTISDMATYLMGVLRSVQAEGPYILGGYSWGGMVAYEMACQLQAQGDTVEFLAIIDTPAQNPAYRHLKNWMQKRGEKKGWNRQQQDRNFLAVRDYVFRIEYFFRAGYRDFTRMRWGEKGAVLVRKAKSGVRKVKTAVATPQAQPGQNESNRGQGQGSDFWSRFHLDPLRLRIVRLNDRAIRLHIPQSYPGHAFIFQSSKGYRNPLNRSAAPMLGWGAVVQGGVEGHQIPGDHLGMLDEPNVQVLAQKLQAALDKTVGD